MLLPLRRLGQSVPRAAVPLCSQGAGGFPSRGVGGTELCVSRPPPPPPRPPRPRCGAVRSPPPYVTHRPGCPVTALPPAVLSAPGTPVSSVPSVPLIAGKVGNFAAFCGANK